MSEATGWVKLQPIPGRGNPCLCCPEIGQTLAMDRLVCVGFGGATVERDGEVVIDGEHAYQTGADVPTVQDAESLAERDPDHDWRIVLYGPLHGDTYQRHGTASWVLVESNEGFA